MKHFFFKHYLSKVAGEDDLTTEEGLPVLEDSDFDMVTREDYVDQDPSEQEHQREQEQFALFNAMGDAAAKVFFEKRVRPLLGSMKQYGKEDVLEALNSEISRFAESATIDLQYLIAEMVKEALGEE